MRYSDFIIWLIPVGLLALDELSKHFPRLESPSKSIAMGIILGMTYSIYMEKLPEIKEITKIVESINENDPAYSLLIKFSNTERTLLELDNDQIRFLFSSQLNKNIERMAAFIDDLENREIKISEGDAALFAIKNFETARISIDATSYVNPEQWWINKDGTISNEGTNYIKKNAEAVRRGIKVRRVFIFDSKNEELTMKKVLEANRKAGVEVYTAFRSSLPKTIGSFDFLSVDGKLAAELVTDRNSRDYNAFLVTCSPNHVNAIDQKIDLILSKAVRS